RARRPRAVRGPARPADGAAAEGGRVRRRLPHLPRELLLLAALACVVASVLLALVAVDVARSRSTIPADDVRFAAGAPTTGWSPRPLAPFHAGERVLGVRDDIAF